MRTCSARSLRVARSITIFISWSFIRATQTIEQCRFFFYQENSLAANFLISSESLEGFKIAGWRLSLLLFAQRKLFLLVFPAKLGHNEAGEVKGTSLVSWYSWVFGWKIRILTCSHVTSGSGRPRSPRHNSWNWPKWLESQINNSYLYFFLLLGGKKEVEIGNFVFSLFPF